MSLKSRKVKSICKTKSYTRLHWTLGYRGNLQKARNDGNRIRQEGISAKLKQERNEDKVRGKK